MRTVSAAWTREWEKLIGRVFVVTVEYKRRYWNGAAYVLEGAATTLDLDDIVDVQSITQKLDVPLASVFKTSNLTLIVKNDKFKWLAGNVTDGIFRPDAASSSGYDGYKSEYVVKGGYKLADGTTEQIAMFTGEAVRYRFDSRSGQCEITLIGRVENKLAGGNAQNICTTITNQSAGTGDGSTKTFNLDKSLWHVSQVRVGGVVKTQGTDYTLSNLENYETVATVTFTVAPAGSAAIDFSGKQWLRDTKASTLVAALATEAGIAAGDQQIQEPAYPSVNQQVNQDSAADWTAATKVNTDAVVKSGSICLGYQLPNGDFETGDFTGWTSASANGGAGATASVGIATGGAHGGSKSANIACFAPEAVSTGYEAYACLVDGSGNEYNRHVFTPTVGVWAQESMTIVALTPTLKLRIAVRDSVNGSYARFDSTNYVSGGSGDGTITFWHTKTGGFIIGSKLDVYIDDVVAHVVSASGTFLTQEIDLLAAPASWGRLEITGTLGGGAWSFETQVASSSGGTYDALVATAADLTILSATKRYLKIKGTLTSNAAQSDGPVIDKLVANFQSSTLFIAHGAFRGKNCQQAIQLIAERTNSEFGTTGDGKLFFRPKSVTVSPVLDLDEGNAVIEVSSYEVDYQGVVNAGQVTYGSYYAEYNDTSAAAASPTSKERFGARAKSISTGDLLFSNSASLAASLARMLYEDGYRPRVRAMVECRLLPQLELGDVVTLSFYDSELLKNIVFGDPFQPFAPAFGQSYNVLAREVVMKVVGLTHAVVPGPNHTRLDLLEVLS